MCVLQTKFHGLNLPGHINSDSEVEHRQLTLYIRAKIIAGKRIRWRGRRRRKIRRKWRGTKRIHDCFVAVLCQTSEVLCSLGARLCSLHLSVCGEQSTGHTQVLDRSFYLCSARCDLAAWVSVRLTSLLLWKLWFVCRICSSTWPVFLPV